MNDIRNCSRCTKQVAAHPLDPVHECVHGERCVVAPTRSDPGSLLCADCDAERIRRQRAERKAGLRHQVAATLRNPGEALRALGGDERGGIQDRGKR